LPSKTICRVEPEFAPAVNYLAIDVP